MRFMKSLELCSDCMMAESYGDKSQLYADEPRYQQVTEGFEKWYAENPGVHLSADFNPESEEGITHGKGPCSICGVCDQTGERIFYRYALSTYSGWSNVSK